MDEADTTTFSWMSPTVSVYSTPDLQDVQKKVSFHSDTGTDDLPKLPDEDDEDAWTDDQRDWYEEENSGPAANLEIINRTLEAVQHNLSPQTLQDLETDGILDHNQVSVLSRVRNLLTGAEEDVMNEKENEDKISPAPKSSDSGIEDTSVSTNYNEKSRIEVGSFLSKLLKGSLRKKEEKRKNDPVS